MHANAPIGLKELLRPITTSWACGAMDNASDYGSEDSRFDSWQARNFFRILLKKVINILTFCQVTFKTTGRLFLV